MIGASDGECVPPIIGDARGAGESSYPCSGDTHLAYLGSFLWTPSSPNGTIGTINADAAGHYVTAIDNFGQAIGSGGLYTPFAANGGSGTLTNIPAQSVDINDSGVIAVSTGFLWTPDTPNATTGTVTPLPVPAGYLAMNPAELNNSTQVVGTMRDSNGITRPFLYKGGTVYDLGTVTSELSSATPAGINDSGQIVLQVFSYGVPTVYLLSPAQLPSADSVVPGAGSAQNQSLVFTFSDPRGWQDLDVVNVLINNFLDGRQSCYLAYSRPLNTLYLVNDTGTALLPGLELNGSPSLEEGPSLLGAAIR
ncbi:hypothetical protein SBA4_50008 [Candidatus Sulfopaludibacter sp. SbA4]|nr:hypothetical protein SBA4_50008 [Candidatus Sulfopaludibacter sp. SbA4]